MPTINRAEPSKPKVAIYHSKGNDEVKNFAGRLRNDNKVDTVLVWSHLFRSDEDRMSVSAIVIEVGAPGAEFIEKTYKAFDPDTEIHKMTPDGEWYEGEDQKNAEEGQPAIQAPAAPAGAAPADDGSVANAGYGSADQASGQEGEQSSDAPSNGDEKERDE